MIKKSISKFQGGKKISLKKRKKLIKIFVKFLISSLVFLVVFLIFCYFSYEFLFWKKVYPFVKITGIDFSGQTFQETENLLKKITEHTKPDEIVFSYGSKKWLLPLEDLSFSYSPTRTAEKALSVGRSQNLKDSLWQKKEAFWQKTNLQIDYLIDYQLLDNQLATIAAQIDIPAIPPAILVLAKANPISGERIEIVKGEPGKAIDKIKAKNEIFLNLGNLTSKEILLSEEQVLPEITDKMALDTKGRANSLLDKKIALNFEKDSWEIQDKEIISFLSFQGDWDRQKIAFYTAGLAKTVDRPAQDSLFNFQDGKVVAFKPAEDGRQLDQEKTTKTIIESLEKLEKNPDEKSTSVTLVVEVSKPKISTAEVNDFGIKELIGEGISWFYGSIAGRIHNIQLASSRLNGILIPPGEIFSFNQTIGDVSEATGYQQAYVIKEGKTVLGDGGGLCQVSTTLFRAALQSGLPIIERRAHAYRVSYYEYNSGPGLDATVYDPSPDFKFKNDTPGYILIQTACDVPGKKLVFQFYGTSDGRQVFISKPRVWDQSPPPPDLYQDDSTLPVGTVKQIDWKAWGAKASFDYKVTRGTEVLQEETFYSSYHPWQAIFLRGTGQ